MAQRTTALFRFNLNGRTVRGCGRDKPVPPLETPRSPRSPREIKTAPPLILHSHFSILNLNGRMVRGCGRAMGASLPEIGRRVGHTVRGCGRDKPVPPLETPRSPRSPQEIKTDPPLIFHSPFSILNLQAPPLILHSQFSIFNLQAPHLILHSHR